MGIMTTNTAFTITLALSTEVKGMHLLGATLATVLSKNLTFLLVTAQGVLVGVEALVVVCPLPCHVAVTGSAMDQRPQKIVLKTVLEQDKHTHLQACLA